MFYGGQIPEANKFCPSPSRHGGGWGWRETTPPPIAFGIESGNKVTQFGIYIITSEKYL